MIPGPILRCARKRAKYHGQSVYLVLTDYGWKVAMYINDDDQRTILRITRKGKVRSA